MDCASEIDAPKTGIRSGNGERKYQRNGSLRSSTKSSGSSGPVERPEKQKKAQAQFSEEVMARKKKEKKWIQKAEKSMEKRGTIGSFGPATKSNIAEGKAAGGLEARRANFAQNMRRIAQRHKGRHSRRR
jgi:hypothetical protein